MTRRPPWHDWTSTQWAAYRSHVASWLEANPGRPNTVMRRCLALADRHLARLEGTS